MVEGLAEVACAGRITSRFDRTSTTDEVINGIDLTGKSAIVTGGASGLGIETARTLARAGAQVRLAVRDLAVGRQVVRDLNAAIGAQRVDVGLLDLADLKSIETFAADWGDAPLSLLINNAGVMACPQNYTAYGAEWQFGTNHLGHHRLATLLLPALSAGAPSRVIALSSSAHQASGIDFDDMHFRARDYHPFRAYGQSKTANALFAVEFDRRFRDRGIRAFAVMPGVIETNLGRHMSDELKAQMGLGASSPTISTIFHKTVEQGAATSVWAATSPDLDEAGGLYLEDCNQALPYLQGLPRGTGVMPHALDADSALRLWEASDAMIGDARERRPLR